MLPLSTLSLVSSAALASNSDPDQALMIAGGAFIAGLVIGLFCVGLLLALIRRVLSAARRVVVFAITAGLVLGIAGVFAAVAYSLAGGTLAL